MLVLNLDKKLSSLCLCPIIIVHGKCEDIKNSHFVTQTPP